MLDKFIILQEIKEVKDTMLLATEQHYDWTDHVNYTVHSIDYIC
jgi:hypothetical protein